MRYLAMMNDPCEAPRAWGIADKREDAVAEARRQLTAYLARGFREFPNEADYTTKVVRGDFG